ncbi:MULTISPECIES: hypothetical protein [Streptomyces]|uniref:Uncharacterized protein n=1 Tax=Streptomyces spororaveus TaxID=284039 RepID=A0ABQ3TG62_9ACTN|nr:MULTISPECIES: hypothetical protein [Streptomyces]MCM9080285.1 hypothetical protein [Streptomyces spororaveus]MCX5305306.1 hypothetical protein [Streptomyces sp. NBC_00160]GHI79391.1 hypothetical protein Sspor_49520 [Streptomyces spororaveus]
MGSSRAYPVFRTDDLADAYRRARLLSGLMKPLDAEMWLCAQALTVPEARGLAALLPTGLFEPSYDWDRDVWFTGAELPRDDRELAAELPLTVDTYAAPGPVEPAFLRALGAGSATMLWYGVWPSAPGIPSAVRDSANQRVELGINEEHPDGRHTLYVHFTYADETGAARLAAAIGGSVLGPAQVGR